MQSCRDLCREPRVREPRASASVAPSAPSSSSREFPNPSNPKPRRVCDPRGRERNRHERARQPRLRGSLVGNDVGVDRGGCRRRPGRGGEPVRGPRRERARSEWLDVTDPIVREGEEPEIAKTYLAARETVERAELGDASRSEVELAIDDLSSVFESLLNAARTA